MIPEHYSRDITRRCQSLICSLGPIVEDGLQDDDEFGGTLRTTFLLAMAMPMVILPVDRIFKPSTGATRVGDDRELDEQLADDVADVLGPGKTFGEAPFAKTKSWSYVPNQTRFNIAATWPSELLDELAAPEAFKAARTASAGRILSGLRNALAHGGVAYLDKDGKNTEGAAVMLAFVSMKDNKEPFRLNILRVHGDDFRVFLIAWADWLRKPRVMDALNNKSRTGA